MTRLTRKRMWGEFDRGHNLVDVFKTRQAAGWIIDGLWTSTFAGRRIRPVLVSWSASKKPKKRGK